MKDVLHAMMFSFREVLRWDIMKYALGGGAIVTLLWGVVGYLLWTPLVSLGSYVLELVPFSMVRSNGAWMLSSLLWIQLVLLTFALLMAFFGTVLMRNSDREDYPRLSIMIALVSAVFWVFVWFFMGDYIYDQLLKLLTWLPFETIEKGVAAIMALYLIYCAIVVSMLVLVSIFSKPILKGVAKRHFPEVKLMGEHTIKSMGYTIRDSGIFVLVSLLAFPLLFVPVVNFIVLVALWIWLVKDTFRYDTASLFFEEVDKEKIKEHSIATFMISLVTAFFNFIPIFNLLGPFFGEIAMFDYLRRQKS